MDKDEKWIRMEVQAGERAATISLEDNGTGINQEALPNIFDRFYRADPSRNTTMGGGGLGLAIAKQMIEGQGGTIWAQSERGHGTRISFTLPYQESSGGDSR